MYGYGANWNNLPDYMKNMMQNYMTGGGGLWFQFSWFIELVISLLIIVLLIGLIRWIWKKGNK